jgi:hypothetical protein
MPKTIAMIKSIPAVMNGKRPGAVVSAPGTLSDMDSIIIQIDRALIAKAAKISRTGLA